MAGDLMDSPPGLSLRHLSRKLTKSIHSKAVTDLWRRRAELNDAIRHLSGVIRANRFARFAGIG